MANVLSSEACRYYCSPSKLFFFQLWVYKWKNYHIWLPPEYGNQIFGDYANRIRACFTTAVTIMYGAYIYTFWIVVILERSGAKSTFESKFDVGVKMTKCECTGGPAGSQVLAWEKSSSEGGPARCCAFYISTRFSFLTCFQTMQNSSSSSVVASSVLRERRKNLTSTTLAGQNTSCHFLEKMCYRSLRASLPDWFEPWDPSAPIFQKILNFRQNLPLPLNTAKLLS